MMALVLLRSYSTTMEAAVAHSLLCSQGILVFRFDPEDQCHTVEPFGIPPRLMVAEEDYEAAAEILAELDEEGSS